MRSPELELTARALVAPGKGILAADESDSTIKKRFDSIEVESTEENRRAYRDMLFTTAGAEEFISGVILFDETLRQASADGTSFPKLLESKGIIPGIKVDKGAKPLANAEGRRSPRVSTACASGSRSTASSARASRSGARPTRSPSTRSCRATTASGRTHTPSRATPALCQEAGLVPIVEPEVLMEGTHTIHDSFKATSRVLFAVYTELRDQRVTLEGTLLKPNMVLAGYDSDEQPSDDEVAEETLRCFRERVPAVCGNRVPVRRAVRRASHVPAERDECARAASVATRSPTGALQAPALKGWLGKPENVEAGQKAYYRRAKFNGAARSGSYMPAWEKETADVA